MSSDGSKLLVGTQGSEIYELSAGDGRSLHPAPLVSGHCADELWGLAMHPTQPKYYTAGDDKSIRAWDAQKRRLLSVTTLSTMTRAVAVSPDGKLVACGLGGRVGRGKCKGEGGLVVLKEADLSVVHTAQDSQQWISDVKFSPDGATLAVGSHDNCIYLYKVAGHAAVPTFTLVLRLSLAICRLKMVSITSLPPAPRLPLWLCR